MINRIVFVEFEDEANAFIDRYLNNDGGIEHSAIVPLSLASQLPFKNRRIPYLNTLHFFDNESHVRTLSQSEEWLQLLESQLETENILHKELGFHIRFVLNHLLWMTEVLVQALDKLKPAKICGPADRAFFGTSQSLTSQDRFLGALLGRLAQKDLFDTELIKIQTPKLSPVPLQEANGVTKNTRHSPFLLRLVDKNFRLLAKNRNTALIASSAYGMKRAVLDPNTVPEDWALFLLDFQTYFEARKKTAKLFFLLLKNRLKSKKRSSLTSLPVRLFPIEASSSDSFKKDIERSVHFLGEQIEGQWKQSFTYKGLDLSSIVAGKLRCGILPYLLRLCEEGHRLKSVLKAVRPSLVLSPFSVGPSAVLGDLCGNLNIPSVLIPHGSLLPPKNQWEEIEWRRLSQAQMLSSYTYTVAQTPLAAKHAAFFKTSEKTWNTGPILFSKLEKRNGSGLRTKLDIPKDVPVIVYAVAQRKRSSVRFYIFETEDECLSSMSDVVQAVNRMEKAHLIIKLHPGTEFSENQMRQLLPKSDRISILQKVPFMDVLAISDLLVSFTSTVIEEAIENRIPVVLFDKWKRFSFFDAFDCSWTAPEQWRADVGYYVNNPARLPRVLSFALSHAEEAAGSSSLYRPYRFEEDERKPLSFYVKRYAHPKKGEHPKP